MYIIAPLGGARNLFPPHLSPRVPVVLFFLPFDDEEPNRRPESCDRLCLCNCALNSGLLCTPGMMATGRRATHLSNNC